jgi:hypothetical protein
LNRASCTGAYWARFQTKRTIPVPTDDGEVPVVLSSSPEMLKDTFRSVPFQFGNVSIRFSRFIGNDRRRTLLPHQQSRLYSELWRALPAGKNHFDQVYGISRQQMRWAERGPTSYSKSSLKY